ncbi:MAG: DUF488 family protein [Actinobacteria bacterium]|mgnify:CR=1 FL=1|nr:DUF488 family protein [Actinomycetota bacterium]OJU85163.1 MAG: hypothetical protein BGO11_20060 [Solirubrobacterales bacterium 70-9]
MGIRTKRVYEPATEDDGLRVLVDRYWPRGLRKEGAKVDLHLTGLAPSGALRRWFDHDPALFERFRSRYVEELERNERPELGDLVERARTGPVTLLFVARDVEHNNAVVLADLLRQRLRLVLDRPGGGR